MNNEKFNILRILNDLMIANLLENKNYNAKQYKKAIFYIEHDEPLPFNKNSSILLKIQEIIETGTLKNYHEIISIDKFNLYKQFKSIFGVGDIKAIELAKKLNTFDEIKNCKLNRIQKIGLNYYNIFNKKNKKKIIMKHILNIKKLLKNNKEIDINVVGSFRRHKNELNYTYKDLDLLITSNKKSLKEIFVPENFLEIICFGDKKIICLFKTDKSIVKVDILLTTKKSFPFAYLYFTGPKLFNIFLRKEAKKQDLKLNEYGLSSNFNTYGLSDVKCTNEKEIFEKLNIPYMDLKKRNTFEIME